MEATSPIVTEIGGVNNAAATTYPATYFGALHGACMKQDAPTKSWVGVEVANYCRDHSTGSEEQNMQDYFANISPGSPDFTQAEKDLFKSLSDTISGFNQLHISNKQFCGKDNNWWYVPHGLEDIDTLNYRYNTKVRDGIYNPQVCMGDASKEGNDILCDYFKCNKSDKDGGALCSTKQNPLYVMKDVQKYKQTIDGPFLSANSDQALVNKYNKEWGDKAKMVQCAHPSQHDCTVENEERRQWGERTRCEQWSKYNHCFTPNPLNYDHSDKDADTNNPILTTEGNCYYAGVGGRGPVGAYYDKEHQYHDRYVRGKDAVSPVNRWNDEGGTAYGMLKWDPLNDTNDITRALNKVEGTAPPGKKYNSYFDLSPYKAKCGDGDVIIEKKVTELGLALKKPIPKDDGPTLVCPAACPYDEDEGKCLPRAVCGALSDSQVKKGLKNWEDGTLKCPKHCVRSLSPSPSNKTMCLPPPEGLHQTICPPMGRNYSLVGKNLGMIETPKRSSAFFHNQNVSRGALDLAVGDGSADALGKIQGVLTSVETIGGPSSAGFDKDGFYQMPQGMNESDSVLCEYEITPDPPDNASGPSSLPPVGPVLVDLLTDPRQVAWMWEGTAESNLPPMDWATSINTLGLYIRGKSTKNPQNLVNLNPNQGSITSENACSNWQDHMIDICMNHEVDAKHCFRPDFNVPDSKWDVIYPIDVPPPGVSPSTNTDCPLIMSKPMKDVWTDYYGVPPDSERVTSNSEYYTGKYCKEWYRGMADTYDRFVDKGADVASRKFVNAATNFCKKYDNGEQPNRFNFECGCINSTPDEFANKHSDIVSAMMQGGPESLGPEQKYCYLGACDVGQVGSLQHDRLIDPRYGNWSFPQAPVIQSPKTEKCSQTVYNIPCLSPSTNYDSELPCWQLKTPGYHPPQLDPSQSYFSPGAVPLCPTPKCVDVKDKYSTEYPVDCGKYTATSLQKCPNLSCEEIVMVSGSVLENDDINSGISICQRSGTNVGNRWLYDVGSGKCVFTETGGTDPDDAKNCFDHGGCPTLTGNTNNPYYYPSYDACTAATQFNVDGTPRTGAPPPAARDVFVDSRKKWSCNNKQCISALGVGEYTSEDACNNFCDRSDKSGYVELVIIILVSLAIFVAMIVFVVRRYRYKSKSKSKPNTTTAPSSSQS